MSHSWWWLLSFLSNLLGISSLQELLYSNEKVPQHWRLSKNIERRILCLQLITCSWFHPKIFCYCFMHQSSVFLPEHSCNDIPLLTLSSYKCKSLILLTDIPNNIFDVLMSKKFQPYSNYCMPMCNVWIIHILYIQDIFSFDLTKIWITW